MTSPIFLHTSRKRTHNEQKHKQEQNCKTLITMDNEKNNNFTLSEDINGPLLAAVFGIEMVAGLITNSFVLMLTLCYLKAWKQPSNIFLTNMLLNNLIIVIFVLPLPVITCASGEWMFGSTWSQKVILCHFTGYIFMYSFFVATESLVLVSFDRFFFIVKVLQYKEYMTVHKAVIIVAVSWILAAILASPPFYGLGRYEFIESYGVCAPGIEKEAGFSIYIFVICLSFVTSIVVTSTWTFCYIRKYLKKRNDRKKYTDSVYISQKWRLIGLFGTLVIIHILCYSLPITTSAIASFLFLPYALYAASFVVLLLNIILIPLAQAYFRYEVRNFVYGFFIKTLPCIDSSRGKETSETITTINESKDVILPNKI